MNIFGNIFSSVESVSADTVYVIGKIKVPNAMRQRRYVGFIGFFV
jgi:hypothetical protein